MVPAGGALWFLFSTFWPIPGREGKGKTLAISHWPYHKRDLREFLECKLLAMVVVGADNIIAWIWSCYLTKSNASIGIYSLHIPSQDY